MEDPWKKASESPILLILFAFLQYFYFFVTRTFRYDSTSFCPNLEPLRLSLSTKTLFFRIEASVSL
jgi:hypothetical protein